MWIYTLFRALMTIDQSQARNIQNQKGGIRRSMTGLSTTTLVAFTNVLARYNTMDMDTMISYVVKWTRRSIVGVHKCVFFSLNSDYSSPFKAASIVSKTPGVEKVHSLSHLSSNEVPVVVPGLDVGEDERCLVRQ